MSRGSSGHTPHLVDKVEGHSPLPDPHLLGLPVFTVLVPDTVHTLLQPSGSFILLPVFLSLQITKKKTWKETGANEMRPCSRTIREQSETMLPMFPTWIIDVTELSQKDNLDCHNTTRTYTQVNITPHIITQRDIPSAHLDPWAGVQHDVLNGALDVLRPRHQPSHFVVMTNFFPLSAWRRLGVLGVPVGRTWTV